MGALAALWIMSGTIEVRTRFIDSQRTRDACCALRGPSAKRTAFHERTSRVRTCAINLTKQLSLSLSLCSRLVIILIIIFRARFVNRRSKIVFWIRKYLFV